MDRTATHLLSIRHPSIPIFHSGGDTVDIESKFEAMRKCHEDAVADIRRLLDDKDEDVRVLVRWLMETEHNPYGFLPEGWANGWSSAQGFAGLCFSIHHALVDDGDIEFTTVDGRPRIAFLHHSEKGFREHVLTSQERELEAHGAAGGRGHSYDVEVLPRKASAFVEAWSSYELRELRNAFEWDAADDFFEAVAKHSSDPRFDPRWVEELNSSRRFRTRRTLKGLSKAKTTCKGPPRTPQPNP